MFASSTERFLDSPESPRSQSSSEYSSEEEQDEERAPRVSFSAHRGSMRREAPPPPAEYEYEIPAEGQELTEEEA